MKSILQKRKSHCLFGEFFLDTSVPNDDKLPLKLSSYVQRDSLPYCIHGILCSFVVNLLFESTFRLLR